MQEFDSQFIDSEFEKLAGAIKRDDEHAGHEALIFIARTLVTDLHRIADALDHIGRNMPGPQVHREIA